MNVKRNGLAPTLSCLALGAASMVGAGCEEQAPVPEDPGVQPNPDQQLDGLEPPSDPFRNSDALDDTPPLTPPDQSTPTTPPDGLNPGGG